MRKVLGCVGGALMTAATAALATTPGGTSLPNAPAQSVRPAYPGMMAGGLLAATPGMARVAEIEVQLAWLADPVTFLDVLEAKFNGSELEIRGTVPNDVVRAWALRVARQHTRLPVLDKVQIKPAREIRPATEADRVVQLAALAALRDSFPRLSGGVEVTVPSEGQVKLTGTVSSYQDKLAMSQRLRPVRGCICVDNQLTVTPEVREGKAFLKVSADGKLQVPSAMPAASLAARVATVPAAPAIQPRPISVPVASSQPVAQPPASMTVPAAAPGLSQPQEPRTLAKLLGFGNSPEPAKRPIAFTPVPSPTVVPKSEGILAATRPVGQDSVASTNGSQVVSTSRFMNTPTQPRMITGTPADSTATASKPLPTAQPPQPANAPGDIRLVRADQVAGSAASRPMSHQPAALLKERITQVCAGSARDVVVVPGGDTSLWISMKVRDTATGERLGRGLMQMPELAPYRVSLEVQVEQ